MFRKSTALMFMLVMTLLITLKHPVLGYCMCEGVYVAGDISCPVQDSSACEYCKNGADTGTDKEPCEDCMKHLNIDVGAFLWSGIDDLSAGSDVMPPPLFFTYLTDTSVSSRLLHTQIDTRGDPPSGPNSNDSRVPIFLRNSTLRI